MCIYAETDRHYLHRKKSTSQNMIEQVWLVQIYCKIKRFCASVPKGEAGRECPDHEFRLKSSSESLEAQTESCSQDPDRQSHTFLWSKACAPSNLLSIPKPLGFSRRVDGFCGLSPLPRRLLTLPGPGGPSHRALHDLPKFALQLCQPSILLADDLGLL